MLDPKLLARERAEKAVRQRVMVETIGGAQELAQELMTRNVGAKLAFDHFRLMGSVSHSAIYCVWEGRDHLAACQRFAARAA